MRDRRSAAATDDARLTLANALDAAAAGAVIMNHAMSTGLERDEFLFKMHERGVGCGVHYRAIPQLSYFAQDFGWTARIPADSPEEAARYAEKAKERDDARAYAASKFAKDILSVADNGVGIPAENLTRIFAHGFTTRKDGHGFGLHSGANAATELGGLFKRLKG